MPQPMSSPIRGGGLLVNRSDLETENEVLRKKIKYLQHIGEVFRQKIGMLMKDAAAGAVKLGDISDVYKRLVAEMPGMDALGSPAPASGVGGNIAAHHESQPPSTTEGQYWHGKFIAATHKIRSMLEENNACENQMADDIRTLQARLREAEIENNTLRMSRPSPSRYHSPHAEAHHVTDASATVIISSMKEDNMALQHQLNDALDRLRTVDSLQQENTMLQKQNLLLRKRIQKTKEANSAMRMDHSENILEMQNNIHVLLASLNEANTELASREAQVDDIAASKADLLNDMQSMQHIISVYKEKLDEYESEAVSRQKAEKSRLIERDRETQVLHDQYMASEGKVSELSVELEALHSQVAEQMRALQENSFKMELLNIEKMTLQEQLNQLKLMICERKEFSTVLGEVQNRLSGAVTELHHMQSTAEVAQRMENLNKTVAGLEFYESQLKQKDDVLASKDDEIEKLKKAIHLLENSIDNISGVFLQMPKSIGEYEQLVIERDAYKSVTEESEVFDPSEVREKVAIKLIELDSKRRASERSKESVVGGSAELAAATMKALQNDDSDEDSEDDVLADPVRSKSTLGLLYESMYSQAQQGHSNQPPPPRVHDDDVLSLEDSPPKPKHPTSAQAEVLPMPIPQQHPYPQHISDSDVIHAFNAFAHGGTMDKDHFRTCAMALGLQCTKAAEDLLRYHDRLGLDEFKHAVKLCQ